MTVRPIAQAGRPVRVLLVEDSAADARLARLALEESPVRATIEVVVDGQAALDRLFGPSSTLPDLVLLDLNLPRVHGFEVLERLKTDARLRRIPVIILSTSGSEPDVDRAYALHANSYVQKPGEFDALVAALSNAMAHWAGDALLAAPP